MSFLSLVLLQICSSVTSLSNGQDHANFCIIFCAMRLLSSASNAIKNYACICVRIKVPMHLCSSHHVSKELWGQSSEQQISSASKLKRLESILNFHCRHDSDSSKNRQIVNLQFFYFEFSWETDGSDSYWLKNREIVNRQFLILNFH